MELSLRQPDEQEFTRILGLISEYELDGRSTEGAQFTAAFRGQELVGFGRLLQHPDCVELCSLGVISTQRRRGIGHAIVHDLLRRAGHDVWVACIIPDYFRPFGFTEASESPAAMLNKVRYCEESLPVPEPYVIMKRSFQG